MSGNLRSGKKYSDIVERVNMNVGMKFWMGVGIRDENGRFAACEKNILLTCKVVQTREIKQLQT